MKKIVFYSLILLFISCKSAKNNSLPKEKIKANFEKIELSSATSIQKKRSYELGKRMLMTCNTSTFKPFTTEEATQEVIQKITQNKISMTCHQVLRGFGQFIDMKLKEVRYNEDTKITLFRYQCEYEKKYRIKELQVYINQENKITSINSTDWKDDYEP
ncbi:hypothetical protein [Flavobacterium filum]|uniref:hypothetical protein n=1 Tax=Flavobacterium TaxID=237 RepID=UPI0003F714B3|nr:hypothetical protein [Flavobacterium filum]